MARTTLRRVRPTEVDVLLAEFGTGQVFWSLLWLALFVLWFFLIVTVFTDIMMSDTLSGWGKALWAIGIIILPFLGILLYLIVEGSSIARRSRVESPSPPAGEPLPATITATQLEDAASRHQAGELSDEEYAEAKARLLD